MGPCCHHFLAGQFVGQSAPTVVEAVRDAMGGCLFIDEAYALADRGGDKFSGEVIRTLLTEVPLLLLFLRNLLLYQCHCRIVPNMIR